MKKTYFVSIFLCNSENISHIRVNSPTLVLLLKMHIYLSNDGDRVREVTRKTVPNIIWDWLTFPNISVQKLKSLQFCNDVLSQVVLSWQCPDNKTSSSLHFDSLIIWHGYYIDSCLFWANYSHHLCSARTVSNMITVLFAGHFRNTYYICIC